MRIVKFGDLPLEEKNQPKYYATVFHEVMEQIRIENKKSNPKPQKMPTIQEMFTRANIRCIEKLETRIRTLENDVQTLTAKIEELKPNR